MSKPLAEYSVEELTEELRRRQARLPTGVGRVLSYSEICATPPPPKDEPDYICPDHKVPVKGGEQCLWCVDWP